MTAMQQLINEIVEHLTYDDDLTEDSRIALETIRLRCLGKLEMEKQQIIDAFELWRTGSGEQYYNETYGSKGSDNSPKVENKDSFGEISDEEIEKAAETFWPKANESSLIRCWILGAKWYREQLKQRQ